MSCFRAAAALMLITSLLGAAPLALPPGVYTNEEDRYFAGERGAAQPDWMSVEVREDGAWRSVDPYGKMLGEWRSNGLPGLTRTDGKVTATAPNGLVTELRRGRGFICWMAISRFARKPGGSEDPLFVGKLRLHDQGGRTAAGGGDSGAPHAIFRLRNVVWPAPSTNRPSLVLYVLKPDNPEKAISYSWADPEANLIGINLRWVQGSCTREESPAASAH